MPKGLQIPIFCRNFAAKKKKEEHYGSLCNDN